MTYKNPFEVLGLNPSIVRSLNNTDILDLANTMYRRLQALYHPDKTDSEDASLKLNEAIELLRNPEDFEYEKKRFLRPKPYQTRAEELEQEVVQKDQLLEQAVRMHQDQMRTYIMALADPLQYSIFDVASKKLHMHDTALDLNLPQDFPPTEEKKDLYFFEMDIDDQGLISTTRTNQQPIQYPDKTLIGVITEDTKTQLRGGIKELIRSTQFFWNQLDINAFRFRQEDSIRYGGTNATTTAVGIRLKRMTPNTTPHQGEERQEFKNHISPESFEVIVPHLTPTLERLSFLFSINKDDNGFYFSLEGRIHSIEEIE